jgi:hypothetical protein
MWRREFRVVVLSVAGLLAATLARAQSMSGELIADPWQSARTAGALPRLPLTPWSPERSKTLDEELVDPWPGRKAGAVPPPSARFADVLIIDPWSQPTWKVPTAAFPPVPEPRVTPRLR